MWQCTSLRPTNSCGTCPRNYSSSRLFAPRIGIQHSRMLNFNWLNWNVSICRRAIQLNRCIYFRECFTSYLRALSSVCNFGKYVKDISWWMWSVCVVWCLAFCCMFSNKWASEHITFSWDYKSIADRDISRRAKYISTDTDTTQSAENQCFPCESIIQRVTVRNRPPHTGTVCTLHSLLAQRDRREKSNTLQS